MDTTTEYLSQEKHNELIKELEQLKKIERKKVAEHLEYAKSLGDLSENAEYHEARDKQADIEDRIKQIETILKNSVIVSRHSHSVVEVGSIVTVEKAADGKTVYQIVGSEEANMGTGKISHQSPIGAALLGHKKGETLTVQAPKGDMEYKIIDIK